jgi:hypothetical protein
MIVITGRGSWDEPHGIIGVDKAKVSDEMAIGFVGNDPTLHMGRGMVCPVLCFSFGDLDFDDDSDLDRDFEEDCRSFKSLLYTVCTMHESRGHRTCMRDHRWYYSLVQEITNSSTTQVSPSAGHTFLRSDRSFGI